MEEDVASGEPLMLLLDLTRRLPPQNVTENIKLLTEIFPEHADDLLSAVDIPLTVREDRQSSGKEYIICDYNREEESYRSPWSNTYDPPLEDPSNIPPPPLRSMEVALNEAFTTYRELYYDAGVSSVYLWDPTGEFPQTLDDPLVRAAPFAGIVLLKKTGDSGTVKGGWDAIHVFEVDPENSKRSASYKLTSTVLLHLNRKDHDDSVVSIQANSDGTLPQSALGSGGSGLGTMSLSGTLTRQSVSTASINSNEGMASHVVNLGRIIEDAENKLRGMLQEVYFSKTKDIVNALRSPESLNEQKKLKAFQQDLLNRMGQRGKRF